jgi:hypothetical protein
VAPAQKKFFLAIKFINFGTSRGTTRVIIEYPHCHDILSLCQFRQRRMGRQAEDARNHICKDCARIPEQIFSTTQYSTTRATKFNFPSPISPNNFSTSALRLSKSLAQAFSKVSNAMHFSWGVGLEMKKSLLLKHRER